MKLQLPKHGFTLVEIMVVVGIIAVLTTSVVIFASRSSEISRNTQRQADLTLLKNAVENYKLRFGRYPEGCKAPGQWSGQPDGAEACAADPLASSIKYIVGKAGGTAAEQFSPNFISVLPKDPRLTSNAQGGYVYTTNADGTVYKIMAMGTVEGADVTVEHSFKSCDFKNNSQLDVLNDGFCGALFIGTSYRQVEDLGGGVEPIHVCHPVSERFQHSYAVWGGLAPLQAVPGGSFPFPGECMGSWCVDPNPSNLTANPLDVFVNSGTPAVPTGSIARELRVRALHGTTQIICK